MIIKLPMGVTVNTIIYRIILIILFVTVLENSPRELIKYTNMKIS